MGNYFIAAFVCGLITYIIADKKGLKNPILWGIGCGALTFIGIGAVIFAKKKIKEKKDNE